MVSINISYDVIAGGIRNIFIPDITYFPAKHQGYLLFERECLEVRLCVKSTSLYLGPSKRPFWNLRTQQHPPFPTIHKDLAISNAISQLQANDADFKSFISGGRKKLVDYYVNNCSKILENIPLFISLIGTYHHAILLMT